ncbi:hypothetical protein MEM_02085 [Candida albicans L26]|nr:hypothetical protein MEM_02085 [Candida albicans L26]KHC81711.1 hypothetical protein W5Q_02100 [Candida albicans SC5314]
MSTQSGITISSQLNDAYKNLSTNSALIIKISSDSTELIPDQIITGSDNTTSTTKDITILEPMFEKLINQISQEFPHPSYIVISYNSNQYFISFIPDIAPIKQKMLYASTKNSLITSLGGNKLIKKFAWTELDELTLNYFIKSIDEDQGFDIKKEEEEELNSLLTEDEITLQKLNNLSLYSTTNHHHHHGFKKKLPSMTNDDGSTTGSGNADQDILYKFTPELTEQLQSIIENSSPESSNDNDNKKSLISFNIDTTKELLTLKSIDTQIEINQLIDTLNNHTSSKISPQYILYNYQIGKLAFIYSCPSGSSVKDRMIYASFKNSLINHLNQLIKSTNIDDDIIIDKNIEVGDLDEIELSQLQDANELIHDTNTNGNNNSSSNSLSSNNSSLSSKNGLKFNKPKGPRRR